VLLLVAGPAAAQSPTLTSDPLEVRFSAEPFDHARTSFRGDLLPQPVAEAEDVTTTDQSIVATLELAGVDRTVDLRLTLATSRRITIHLQPPNPDARTTVAFADQGQHYYGVWEQTGVYGYKIGGGEGEMPDSLINRQVTLFNRAAHEQMQAHHGEDFFVGRPRGDGVRTAGDSAPLRSRGGGHSAGRPACFRSSPPGVQRRFRLTERRGRHVVSSKQCQLGRNPNRGTRLVVCTFRNIRPVKPPTPAL